MSHTAYQHAKKSTLKTPSYQYASDSLYQFKHTQLKKAHAFCGYIDWNSLWSPLVTTYTAAVQTRWVEMNANFAFITYD